MNTPSVDNVLMLNVDEIHLCDRCEGLGYIQYSHFDSLNPVIEDCPKCKGSGRLHIYGKLKVEPYLKIIPNNVENKV